MSTGLKTAHVRVLYPAVSVAHTVVYHALIRRRDDDLPCAFEQARAGRARGVGGRESRGVPAYLPLLEAVGVVQKVRDVRPPRRLLT